MAATVARASNVEGQLSATIQAITATTQAATDADVTVAAITAGSLIVVKGFVFPVKGPHTFSNDFGAPRNVGTTYEHKHQGNDIFAAGGTPLVACEQGVVVRIGTDVLGGTKLWLVGVSGTTYYYAHLMGYAPDVHDDMAVEAGHVLGYVGNSGDASGGPTHLHFEVHPNAGPAVNPYFLLRAVNRIAAA